MSSTVLPITPPSTSQSAIKIKHPDAICPSWCCTDQLRYSGETQQMYKQSINICLHKPDLAPSVLGHHSAARSFLMISSATKFPRPPASHIFHHSPWHQLAFYSPSFCLFIVQSSAIFPLPKGRALARVIPHSLEQDLLHTNMLHNIATWEHILCPSHF